MSRFTSILLVSPLADGKTWVLMREFGYDFGSMGSLDQNQADRADGYNRVLPTLPIKATATAERRSQCIQLARHLLGRTGR